ncbi:MAG: hypothetical protein L0099_09620 [Acidobacteria bacterium]|nr:hypothetical protein [Acidobacteriota bacterium]
MKKWLDEPGEGLAEALLVLLTCVVVILGMARLVSQTVGRFFQAAAKAMGLG